MRRSLEGRTSARGAEVDQGKGLVGLWPKSGDSPETEPCAPQTEKKKSKKARKKELLGKS